LLFPHVENIIYSAFEGVQGGIYSFPLFVENTSFKCTWHVGGDNYLNVKSHNEIMNWWEKKGQYKNLKDFRL
jgi:hypothetical protein